MKNVLDLAKDIRKNDEHVLKRAKLEETIKPPIPNFPPYENVIFGTLTTIPDVLKDPNYSDVLIENLEIEARIGMFMTGNKRLFPRCSKRIAYGMDPENRRETEKTIDPLFRTKFHSGIDESFAKRLKLKLMKKELFLSEVQSKQIQFVDGEGNRFMKDPIHPTQYQHERKEKLKMFDISLLAHDYDLRIACATEIITTSTSSSVSNGKLSALHGFTERHKYRTTYQLLKNAKWKIDFTEVITQSTPLSNSNPSLSTMNSSNNNNVRGYELEFEVKKEFLIVWLQAEDRQQLTLDLFAELKYLLDYCIPSESDHEGEVELKPCDLQLNHQLTPLIGDINKLIKPETIGVEFLGSMPINLFRSSLANVLQSQYYLTEKTDGVRYLLYILPHPLKPNTSTRLAVFMNRSKELFVYKQSELLGSCFPPYTILDGEIVYNRHHKKSIFLIFDILCYQSQSYIPELFSERYEFIKKTIVPQYHNTLKTQQQEQLTATPSAPPTIDLLIHYKKFVPKEGLSELLKCFQIENGERIYQENELRYHPTDGIIFQPNTPYHFSKDYDLLKWKWSDLRSIDLKLQIPSVSSSSVNVPNFFAGISHQDIYLLCTGPNGSPINISKRGDYNVGLGFYDTARLLVELEEVFQLQRGKSFEKIIIEVIYDVQVGKWMYSKIRADKNEPNYIDSVLGVFIEQAEAISLEELEYTLLASVRKLELDYETKLTKMKNELLDWQRKRK